MTYKICYWDEVSKTQKERDATPEETAEIEARKIAPPPVPQVVTRFQALAALELFGYLTTVEAIMANPATPKMTKLAYENALTFERTSTTLQTLAMVLGLSEAALDQLFITADGIKA